jgi:hypothetical protein
MRKIFGSFSKPMLLGLLSLLLMFPLMSAAQTAPATGGGGSNDCYSPPSTGSGSTPICTNHPFFQADNPCFLGKRVSGILQTIIERVENSVSNASRNIFDAITLDPGYELIVGASMTLMIIFFAVGVMFGFLQPQLGQLIIRLVKIGLLAWILTPGYGWTLIEDYFIRFFGPAGPSSPYYRQTGTDYLISAMISIAQTGSASGATAGPNSPFQVIESTVNLVFSPRMFVTAVASFATVPFGPAVGLAMLWAIFSFVWALLRALLIYVLSNIVKSLLFGLAPIFFVFLLFDKTKQLFTGWLNQLINFSLQPILMFAFLAFFSTLISSSAKAILARPDTHVCYVHSSQQGTTPFSMENWQFICPDGNTIRPYSGQRTATGALECPSGRISPVSIVDILVFLLMVHIAGAVMSVIPGLAVEMSQGVTRLDQAISNMSGFGSQRGNAAAQYQQLRNPTPSRPPS